MHFSPDITLVCRSVAHFVVDKKDDLLGIILTHAHEDHIGAITYVWKKLKCKIAVVFLSENITK